MLIFLVSIGREDISSKNKKKRLPALTQAIGCDDRPSFILRLSGDPVSLRPEIHCLVNSLAPQHLEDILQCKMPAVGFAQVDVRPVQQERADPIRQTPQQRDRHDKIRIDPRSGSSSHRKSVLDGMLSFSAIASLVSPLRFISMSKASRKVFGSCACTAVPPRSHPFPFR